MATKNAKKTYKAKTWEERKKEIDDLTGNMEKRIPEYFRSGESIKEYLDFMGKFHNYSSNNATMIESQFTGAEAVGSFAFWKSKGFSVNKGEKGIKVLVPKKTTYFRRGDKEVQLKYANADERKQIKNKEIKTHSRTHFSLGNVFDVSQTNATLDDLPEIFPNRWLEGNVENYQTMYNALEKVADSHNVKIIEPKSELGAAKGVSYTLTREVALNPRNSELQNVKTLAHELAHAVLHTKETHQNHTSQEKEFQAEMVAYTVSSYFGLDTTEYSLPYLNSWTNGKKLEDQERLLKEVRDTAHNFISRIESELMKEREKEMENAKNNEFLSNLNHDNFYEEALAIQENYGVLSNVVEWENEAFLNTLKDVSPEDFEKFQACKAYHNKLLEDRQGEGKSVLLIEFGALSSTEQKYVSMEELKRIAEKGEHRDTTSLKNESLSDKAYLESFNQVFGEKYAAVDDLTLEQPMVLIQWSESNELASNTILPYGEANDLMGKLETKYADDLSYYKTRYHVLFSKEFSEDGKVTVLNMDRLDIGDGSYVNPHHQIKNERKLPTEKQQALDNAFHDFLLKEEEKETSEWLNNNRNKVIQELER